MALSMGELAPIMDGFVKAIKLSINSAKLYHRISLTILSMGYTIAKQIKFGINPMLYRSIGIGFYLLEHTKNKKNILKYLIRVFRSQSSFLNNKLLTKSPECVKVQFFRKKTKNTIITLQKQQASQFQQGMIS